MSRDYVYLRWHIADVCSTGYEFSYVSITGHCYVLEEDFQCFHYPQVLSTTTLTTPGQRLITQNI